MNNGTSRPKEGERLSDIPWGEIKTIIDKFAEEGLPRKSFERVMQNWTYRQAVVQFMCTGYDEQKKAEDQTKQKAERSKKRHRFQCSGSVHGDTVLENFCANAAREPDRFLRTLAFSFVYSVAYVNRGDGNSELSKEHVAALLTSLPVAKGELAAATPGGIIGAWGFVSYCRSACEQFFAPDAFFQYAKKSHSGLHYGLEEALKAHWCRYIEDPVLLLQALAVEFCKLLMDSGRSKKKAELLLKLFDKLGFNHGIPEVDSGNMLNQYCKTVLEWVEVQGKYPDFSSYFSPEHCCDRMHTLYCRIYAQPAILGGRLSKGLFMFVPEDKAHQKREERIYFDSCPFCGTKVYTPPGVEIFDSDKDAGRLNIWRS